MIRAIVLAFVVLWGCSEKPAPIAAANVPGDTRIQLERMGAVRMQTPAEVAASQAAAAQPSPVAPSPCYSSLRRGATRHCSPKPAPAKPKALKPSDEKIAFVTGALNGARAECLRVIVDVKIEGDVVLGRIRDFGMTALDAPICHDTDTLVQVEIELESQGKIVRPASLR